MANTHNPENGPNRASQVTPEDTPNTASWETQYLEAANETNSPSFKPKPYRNTDEGDPGTQYPMNRQQGVKGS